jgi:hypothetical protein
LWLFALRWLARDSMPTVQLGCGVLCAAMPYFWYRALRELQPRPRALIGAIVIGLIPESISMYAYFMNETLLMTLLGACFWMTLRARRKATLASFAAAVLLWLCASLTRTVAAPMAAGCVLWLWLTQGQRLGKMLVGAALVCALVIPAGLYGSAKLGFFAPLGNLYFNEIYNSGGKRDIAVDYGPDGMYRFGSPSFYNPTFYPFSSWTTDRDGVVSISIDLSKGRAPWIAENERVKRERTFPAWRQRAEDFWYLLFAQGWPNSDPATVCGWLALWTRWLWAPLMVWVAFGLATRRFSGAAYVVPLCVMGTIALLIVQHEGVIEGRFREPLDAILVGAALLMSPPRRAALP